MSQHDLEYSVSTALKGMALTDEFKKFVTSNRELWLTFGKMDSHLYRKKLMKLMEAAKLTKDQKIVVYFLFTIVGKKSRVIDGMNAMPDHVKSMAWFDPVRAFIATTMTDYNTSAKAVDKFPGTHVAATNPGLSLMLWKLSVEEEARTVEAFFAKPITVQLHLSQECQERAKSGYKFYWDETVQGSKNTMNTEEAKYREEYYNTSAGDKYLLVTDGLREVEPANKNLGYSMKEIEMWLTAKV